MREVKRVLCLTCVALLLLVAGCSLKQINNQANLLDRRGAIDGSVEVHVADPGPVYVQLYKPVEQHVVFMDKLPLAKSHEYHFDVLPGSYMVGAFVDSNNDGEWQVEEDATYLGIENTMPTTITVAEKQTVNIGALAIKGPIETRTGIEVRNALTKVTANIGRVIALDDPMFSHENAAMGFWRPFDYADQYGGGLMMLQEYEEKKTPVVFVHGITGTGLEFEPVIASLDRERFQAWVLQYPSGVSLDLVSDYFLESLDQLHIRYQFPRVIVVAHSMGGLMARSFVMKHQQSGASYSLSMVMTINSPLYGMDSAAKGVKLSPIVIPAWRDVASGSDFVNKVHAWHWPREIPYHLVFSFLPHKEGDGVVPMRSQLSLSLQDEAVKIHGFQAQHAEVLRDDEFIKRFHSILSGYY